MLLVDVELDVEEFDEEEDDEDEQVVDVTGGWWPLLSAPELGSGHDRELWAEVMICWPPGAIAMGAGGWPMLAVGCGCGGGGGGGCWKKKAPGNWPQIEAGIRGEKGQAPSSAAPVGSVR